VLRLRKEAGTRLTQLCQSVAGAGTTGGAVVTGMMQVGIWVTGLCHPSRIPPASPARPTPSAEVHDAPARSAFRSRPRAAPRMAPRVRAELGRGASVRPGEPVALGRAPAPRG